MKKQTRAIDMFFRPEEELEKSAGIFDKLGDLWYRPTGIFRFHLSPAPYCREELLAEHWRPICLNTPDWIIKEFGKCYYGIDEGRDVSEMLKDFAYYLFRNGLQNYVTIGECFNRNGPYSVCFVGSEGAADEATPKRWYAEKFLQLHIDFEE